MEDCAKDLDYCFGGFGDEIIGKVSCILGNSFTPKYNKTGVTFYGTNGRILKLVSRVTRLEVEFNTWLAEHPEVIVLSDNEAREKKMGTCRWIYKGDNLDKVLDLVKEAKVNHNL